MKTIHTSDIDLLALLSGHDHMTVFAVLTGVLLAIALKLSLGR